MRLIIGAVSIRVTQMGADFVLVESPIDHPPTAASMALKVDQSERRWKVGLPNGMSANAKRVAIAACA